MQYLSHAKFLKPGALLMIVMLAACQMTKGSITRHEDRLAAAGFVVKPANTPERQDMLHRLPPNKFVQRANGDDIKYVYADPVVCGCLYVGTQAAYAQFQRDRQQRQMADQQQMSAQMYSDSAWNWGAWGPWGPGMGFGYGMGW